VSTAHGPVSEEARVLSEEVDHLRMRVTSLERSERAFFVAFAFVMAACAVAKVMQ
jgi:hypothetical protein